MPVIYQHFSLGFDPFLGKYTLGSKNSALSLATENTYTWSRKFTTTISTFTFSSSTTTFSAAATTFSGNHSLSTAIPTIIEGYSTIIEVDGQNAPPFSTVQAGETDAMYPSTVNGGQEATPTMTNNLSIETDELLSPPAVPPQLHPPSSRPQPPSHHLVSAPDQPAASTLSSHSGANTCTPIQLQSDEPTQVMLI